MDLRPLAEQNHGGARCSSAHRRSGHRRRNDAHPRTVFDRLRHRRQRLHPHGPQPPGSLGDRRCRRLGDHHRRLRRHGLHDPSRRPMDQRRTGPNHGLHLYRRPPAASAHPRRGGPGVRVRTAGADGAEQLHRRDAHPRGRADGSARPLPVRRPRRVRRRPPHLRRDHHRAGHRLDPVAAPLRTGTAGEAVATRHLGGGGGGGEPLGDEPPQICVAEGRSSIRRRSRP
jgi:hypothetical protein